MKRIPLGIIVISVVLFFVAIATDIFWVAKLVGRPFPKTMPVSITVYNALVLLAVGLCVGFLVILFSLSGSAPETIAIAGSYVLFLGLVCLILAGLNYIGIFALGFTKFLVLVGVGWLSLGFVPMIIMKTYQGRMDALKDSVFNFFTGID